MSHRSDSNGNSSANGNSYLDKRLLANGTNGESSQSSMRLAQHHIRKAWSKIWTKKTLEQRIPIVNWLPAYTFSTLFSDIVAGLTVGLTAIPQGIAYAVVAGLEPQYGLYSGFMGCFVYLFLGSCKDITIGPTAIMALMTQKAVADYNSDIAVLLCFLSGAVIFTLGIFHLGFLVDFISVPVVVGFTSASAITIACSQLKPILGIKGKSNEFLQTWIEVTEHIEETRYQDLILGIVTVIVLISLKVANDKNQNRLRGRTDLGTGTKVFKETVRVVSLARNALVVIAGTLLAYIFSVNGMEPFTLTGKITGGMPPFQPPPFSTIINNVTIPFHEMVSELGSSIISIPLIAVLESIAIAKAFAKGKSLDATQEMFALGMSNMVGSFVRSMPVTGSFTRTAVNNASGVKTPLGGIFTGALVLAALTLTSTFYYIPKATLAGVIIAAMFYMVEYHEMYIIWKTKKLDVIPLFCTIIGCLFLGLDYGILLGIGVNLIFVLYNVARPRLIKEQKQVSESKVLLIRPEESLTYPSAEYVRETIMRSCEKSGKDSILIIDGSQLRSIDATVAKNIKTLTKDLTSNEQDVIFWNWQKHPRRACLALDATLAKYFSDEESVERLLQEKQSEVPRCKIKKDYSIDKY